MKLMDIFLKNPAKNKNMVTMINRIFEQNAVCIEDENFKYTVVETLRQLLSSSYAQADSQLMAGISREGLVACTKLFERCSSESVKYQDLLSLAWKRIQNKEYNYYWFFEVILSKFFKKVDEDSELYAHCSEFVQGSLFSLPLMEQHFEQYFH